jgi:hypothetical protein
MEASRVTRAQLLAEADVDAPGRLRRRSRYYGRTIPRYRLYGNAAL